MTRRSDTRSGRVQRKLHPPYGVVAVDRRVEGLSWVKPIFK